MKHYLFKIKLDEPVLFALDEWILGLKEDCLSQDEVKPVVNCNALGVTYVLSTKFNIISLVQEKTGRTLYLDIISPFVINLFNVKRYIRKTLPIKQIDGVELQRNDEHLYN